jgi:hypothetical protein
MFRRGPSSRHSIPDEPSFSEPSSSDTIKVPAFVPGTDYYAKFCVFYLQSHRMDKKVKVAEGELQSLKAKFGKLQLVAADSNFNLEEMGNQMDKAMEIAFDRAFERVVERLQTKINTSLTIWERTITEHVESGLENAMKQVTHVVENLDRRLDQLSTSTHQVVSNYSIPYKPNFPTSDTPDTLTANSDDDETVFGGKAEMQQPVSLTRSFTFKDNPVISPAELQRTKAKNRSAVVKDILTREQMYLRNLRTVAEIYIKPLRDLANSWDPILSYAEIDIIFSSLEVITSLTLQFCKELVRRQMQNQPDFKWSDIFLKMAQDLREPYIAYIRNQDKAMSTLTKIMQNNKAFKSFLSDCRDSARILVGDVDVTRFLEMPAERLPQYVDLLDQLVKATPSDSIEYNDLNRALIKMKETHELIIRHAVDHKRLEELQRIAHSITDITDIDIVSNKHSFVREGPVRVLLPNADAPKNRYLFLFTDMIILTKRGILKAAFTFETKISLVAVQNITPVDTDIFL